MSFDSEGRVIREELRYRIRDRIGRYYLIECSEDGISINLGNSLFQDKTYRAEIEDAIGMLWGNHTFLSIMNEEYRSKNRAWMDTHIKPEMATVLEYIRGIATNSMSMCDETTSVGRIGLSLECGEISTDDRRALEAYENAISRFLGRLYSDVREAYYRTDESSERNLKIPRSPLLRCQGSVLSHR